MPNTNETLVLLARVDESLEALRDALIALGCGDEDVYRVEVSVDAARAIAEAKAIISGLCDADAHGYAIDEANDASITTVMNRPATLKERARWWLEDRRADHD